MRFLAQSLSLRMSIDDSAINLNDVHDKFVIRICVNQLADFTGDKFCFTHNYSQSFTKSIHSLKCENDVLLGFE